MMRIKKTIEAEVCPICAGKLPVNDGYCSNCGYDASMDYESYPTLQLFSGGLTKAEHMEVYKKKQKAEREDEKRQLMKLPEYKKLKSRVEELEAATVLWEAERSDIVTERDDLKKYVESLKIRIMQLQVQNKEMLMKTSRLEREKTDAQEKAKALERQASMLRERLAKAIGQDLGNENEEIKKILQDAMLHNNSVRKITYANGDVYEGSILNGKRHGKGKLISKSGDIYEGDWQNDKKHGKGKQIYKAGGVYEGEFKNDAVNGYGTFTDSKGRVLKGYFENNKFVR